MKIYTEKSVSAKNNIESDINLFINVLQKAVPNTFVWLHELKYQKKKKISCKDISKNILTFKNSYINDMKLINVENSDFKEKLKTLKTYKINKPYFKRLEKKLVKLICILEESQEKLKNNTISEEKKIEIQKILFKFLQKTFQKNFYIFLLKIIKFKGIGYLIDDIVDILRLFLYSIIKIKYKKDSLYSFILISKKMDEILTRLSEI